MRERPAAVEPDRFIAEPFDERQRMGNEQNRLAAPAEFAELVETLVRKAFVANGKDFIDEQHVRIDVDRDGETQAHVHAGRVRLDRRVDEVAQLGKLDDIVEAVLDLFLGQAQHDPVDKHVFASRDLGMKSGAEFDERRDAAFDDDRPEGRLRDPRDQLQRGALAGAVAADHAKGRALRDSERDIGQRRERLAWAQIASDAPLQQRALEGGEMAAAVLPVHLRDVIQLDRRSHTDSANESRRRSNTQ